MDASHVYVRAWALGCFYSHIYIYQYPNLSKGADRVAGQLLGDKECPFSGVTKSGRVWRKVPESDARSAGLVHILSDHRFPAPFPSNSACLNSLRHYEPNSKHWFTTSFLQPLPYLVTPQGQENCQPKLASPHYKPVENEVKFGLPEPCSAN